MITLLCWWCNYFSYSTSLTNGSKFFMVCILHYFKLPFKLNSYQMPKRPHSWFLHNYSRLLPIAHTISTLDGNNLGRVTSYNYLGIWLDKLTFGVFLKKTGCSVPCCKMYYNRHKSKVTSLQTVWNDSMDITLRRKTHILIYKSSKLTEQCQCF